MDKDKHMSKGEGSASEEYGWIRSVPTNPWKLWAILCNMQYIAEVSKLLRCIECRTILFTWPNIPKISRECIVRIDQGLAPGVVDGHATTNTWSWLRHQMETFSALLAICAGNSPVTGEFPSQMPMTRSFDVFWSAPEQRLSKQSRRRWFETPLRSLWRYCNVVAWSTSTPDVKRLAMSILPRSFRCEKLNHAKYTVFEVALFPPLTDIAGFNSTRPYP